MVDENELVSLKGAPDTIDRAFYCRFNQLETLEGAPKRTEEFYCGLNKKKFTKADVRAVTKVKGVIEV